MGVRFTGRLCPGPAAKGEVSWGWSDGPGLQPAAAAAATACASRAAAAGAGAGGAAGLVAACVSCGSRRRGNTSPSEHSRLAERWSPLNTAPLKAPQQGWSLPRLRLLSRRSFKLRTEVTER